MHWSLCSPLSPLVISALVPCIIAASEGENSSPQPLPNGDSVCDCFLSNGTQPAYFSNHMFFDFRNLTKDAGVPAVITNETLATIARPTSEYFSSDEWTSIWQLQGWSNSEGKGKGLSGEAAVLMVYSPANVYIQKNGDEDDDDATSETFMTLRTQRLPKFQSAAAFQTKTSDYQFVSLRMLARTTGGPGAVTAMFTYGNPNTTSSVQEADFEVLTRGPREKVQYTNQPSFTSDGQVNPDATQNVTLPDDMIWSQWAVHRLDWTAESSVWYVDGQQLANITFQVPRAASGINFNAWSDGGSWSGNMSLYDEASLQIQWIEMIYNTTTASQSSSTRRDPSRLWSRDVGPQGEMLRRRGDLSARSTSSTGNGNCKVVCSIDEVTEAGAATMLWNSTATRIAGADAGSGMALAWALFTGSLFWLLAV
ncbi:glycoside hydrolase family 16 [Trichoderma arundinaceum]|uniref:Glycoside hydrolase family 16 n=1 Tax=Trichoderma arundinaceum TaxID=490622 RepID=A0A395NBU7_TRIAR|nr:glycoside hydrolase family 16 [Trichoderma arundinaceum]